MTGKKKSRPYQNVVSFKVEENSERNPKTNKLCKKIWFLRPTKDVTDRADYRLFRVGRNGDFKSTCYGLVDKNGNPQEDFDTANKKIDKYLTDKHIKFKSSYKSKSNKTNWDEYPDSRPIGPITREENLDNIIEMRRERSRKARAEKRVAEATKAVADTKDTSKSDGEKMTRERAREILGYDVGYHPDKNGKNVYVNETKLKTRARLALKNGKKTNRRYGRRRYYQINNFF